MTDQGASDPSGERHKAPHSMRRWCGEEQSMLGAGIQPNAELSLKQGRFILRAAAEASRQELIVLTEEE